MFYKLHQYLVVADAELSECLDAIVSHKVLPVLGGQYLPATIMFGSDLYGEFLTFHLTDMGAGVLELKAHAGGMTEDEGAKALIVVNCIRNAAGQWVFQHATAYHQPIDFNAAMVFLDRYADLPLLAVEIHDELAA